MSLAELTSWCDDRFGRHEPAPDLRPRWCDAPWIVMDSSAAAAEFRWTPEIGIGQILSEIAAHAEQHPDWLERTGA